MIRLSKNTCTNVLLIMMLLFLFQFIFAKGFDNKKISQDKICIFNGYPYRAGKIFAKKIQTELMLNNKIVIAMLMNYPLRVNMANDKGKQITFYVRKKKEFLNYYNKIFNPYQRKAILKADPNDVFCNDQGMSFANGLIWFNPDKEGAKIFAINVSDGVYNKVGWL